ncbi:MAG: hypothetical protein ACYCXX_13570 [Acidiferrobacter thiooxydans]
MNTNSRKQDARTEGSGLNNPQGGQGQGHDFEMWVDLPGGICEVKRQQTKKGPRFYYWSGWLYGRWIPCKASEVIYRNSEDRNHD